MFYLGKIISKTSQTAIFWPNQLQTPPNKFSPIKTKMRAFLFGTVPLNLVEPCHN